MNLIEMIKNYLNSDKKAYEPLSSVFAAIGIIILLILIFEFLPWFGIVSAVLVVFLIMMFISCVIGFFQDLESKKKKKNK